MAFVVLKIDFKDKVTEEELIKHFDKFVENGTIPKYGVPDKIIFVDELPKTSVGKLDKKVLRKKFI